VPDSKATRHPPIREDGLKDIVGKDSRRDPNGRLHALELIATGPGPSQEPGILIPGLWRNRGKHRKIA
jgi:hypothetical protein